MDKEISFPVRINRYLALKGICTRRQADELIQKKKVRINGRVAVLGDKVNKDDIVETFLKSKEKDFVYIAYSKPFGVVTHSAQENEKDIISTTKFKEKVFPVGRLDKDSYGLIILTNDGRIIDRLLNPVLAHEKEYFVKVDKPISGRFLRSFEKGVLIEGYKTRPAKVFEAGTTSFRIVLTEGKRHQIRRMCAALGFRVLELKRVRIMNIRLGNLKPGEHRYFSDRERKEFLQKLGLLK